MAVLYGASPDVALLRKAKNCVKGLEMFYREVLDALRMPLIFQWLASTSAARLSSIGIIRSTWVPCRPGADSKKLFDLRLYAIKQRLFRFPI